jgi:endo-beta-N-acetylglucosaminidase D
MVLVVSTSMVSFANMETLFWRKCKEDPKEMVICNHEWIWICNLVCIRLYVLSKTFRSNGQHTVFAMTKQRAISGS